MKAAYFFDGRHHTEAQIVHAFRPLARRIASDGRRLSERIDFQPPGGAQTLDRISLAAYLDRIGAAGTGASPMRSRGAWRTRFDSTTGWSPSVAAVQATP